MGGLYAPPEKLWRILCYSIKLHNYMADSPIILYLECLKVLIYLLKKLGQHDLNKKIYIKICKKRILNHGTDFNEI